jgi:hypothetical protein
MTSSARNSSTVTRPRRGAGLLRAADKLLKSDPDILGIFSTFVGKE